MTAETQGIEMGDIVSVEGSTEEWKVYWMYGNGQVELVNKYHREYPESVTAAQLTLIRKGERAT